MINLHTKQLIERYLAGDQKAGQVLRERLQNEPELEAELAEQIQMHRLLGYASQAHSGDQFTKAVIERIKTTQKLRVQGKKTWLIAATASFVLLCFLWFGLLWQAPASSVGSISKLAGAYPDFLPAKPP